MPQKSKVNNKIGETVFSIIFALLLLYGYHSCTSDNQTTIVQSTTQTVSSETVCKNWLNKVTEQQGNAILSAAQGDFSAASYQQGGVISSLIGAKHSCDESWMEYIERQLNIATEDKKKYEALKKG